ncbi:unnamed protein product [Cercospora beticola]|nr:unnamed protein product [Cercospora beticola]
MVMRTEEFGIAVLASRLWHTKLGAISSACDRQNHIVVNGDPNAILSFALPLLPPYLHHVLFSNLTTRWLILTRPRTPRPNLPRDPSLHPASLPLPQQPRAPRSNLPSAS